jgi:hypothetical protein
MSVKIFMTKFGFIIGEQIKEADDQVILENPGLIQMAQSEGGMKFIISKMFPPILANEKELYKKFPIRKTDIVYCGPAIPDMIQSFKKYVGTLIENRSGIKIFGSGAMDKLKGLGGGIIK